MELNTISETQMPTRIAKLSVPELGLLAWPRLEGMAIELVGLLQAVVFPLRAVETGKRHAIGLINSILSRSTRHARNGARDASEQFS